MDDTVIKDKKIEKAEIKKSLPKVILKTIKKIGSLPLGFDKNDIVFIDDNKIYIGKKK